jgi:hypothetical protein
MASGALVAAVSVDRAEIPGRAPEAYFGATVGPKLLVDDPAVLAAPFAGVGTDAAQQAAENQAGFKGVLGDSSTPGLDFYEKFHIIPRRIDLGNVLSTTTVALEVFSAFRSSPQFWTMFDNNAGQGVTLLGAPTLPVLVQPMAGFDLDVEVSLIGPAVVDATLDFTFNVTGLIQVPITLQRVVLFAVRPELEYEEILQWLTDVFPHVDGTEQRRSVRKNPRQLLDWSVLVEDGVERSILENVLFDWQSRAFGLPQWHELTPLSGTVTGGSTTVLTVVTTADADFRDGGLLVVYESQTKFDVLNLVSHTATTLTVENPPQNSYAPGADVVVAPLRLGTLTGDPGGQRYRTGLERVQTRFRVKDNDANLGDASTFPTFASKVLLDDFNFVQGTMPESYRQTVVTIDGDVGLTAEYARSDRHRRGSVKQFVVGTKAALWRVRRLLHFLSGRRISFFVPTFSRDLVPLANITSGMTTLAVSNVGYTNFVRSRQPKNVIRVVPVVGAGSPFLRTILSSTVNTSVQETITVDSTWPSTLTPSQVERIEFVEKVRQDSDEVRIRHERGGTTRRISVPIRTVLE